MRIKILSLAILVIVIGLSYGKSSSYWEEGMERRNEKSFMLSLQLAFKNAWEAFTTTKTPSWPCNISSCRNGATLKMANNGMCPTCECTAGCYGAECETCNGVSTTTLMPTTTSTMNECSILSCNNGGTLILNNNGMCPTCACASGCYGAKCETCTSAPTTPSTSLVSTTKTQTNSSYCTSANQNTFCLTGTVNRTGNRCSCNCRFGYIGEHCELLDTCLVYQHCQNGGTAYYNPSAKACKCSCLPCYSGNSCEKFEDPNCYPTTSPATTPVPMCESNCLYGSMIGNDTDCRCACNYGAFGTYCDKTLMCSIDCKSGGSPYYDPSTGKCKCACTPGWSGETCLEVAS